MLRLLQGECRRTGSRTADLAAERSYASQVEPWLEAARVVGDAYCVGCCLAWLAERAADLEGDIRCLLRLLRRVTPRTVRFRCSPHHIHIGMANLLAARRELTVDEYEAFAHGGAWWDATGRGARVPAGRARR